MLRTVRAPGAFSLVLILSYAVYFLRFVGLPSWRDDSMGLDDWDQHTFYLEAVIRSIKAFQVPFWNPYYNGGMPILENPQVRLFTPTVWFGLIAGSVSGLKLSVPFYYLIGCLSGWYLFDRTLKFNPIVSAICTITFVFSGFLPQHLFAGHTNYMTVQLFPLIYALFIRFNAAGQLRFAPGLAFALCFAWVVWDGFIYGFLFLVVFFSILSIFELRKPNAETALKLGTLVLFTLGLVAVRIIPASAFYLQQGAYTTGTHEILTPLEILKTFTATAQHPVFAKNIAAQAHNWWEYGNYIGIVPIVSLLLLVPFLRKKDMPILAGLILALTLMSGEFHPLSPASLVSKIPGFGGMRCHARWGPIALLCLVVLLGSLAERALSLGEKRTWLKYLLHLVSICAFLYLGYDLRTNRKPLIAVFETGVHERSLIFRQDQNLVTVASLPGYGAASAQFQAMLNHMSLREGYEMLNWKARVTAQGEPGYKGEFYLQGTGKSVVPRVWSMNRMEFEIESHTPDTLVINQNFYPGWKASGDYSATSLDGLISVQLKPGKNLVTLSYVSYLGVLGMVVSIATLIIGAFLVFRRRR
ncbi:MAG: hypothetical protein K8S54_11120 [Spirochaetia bacterium]|nr:hypothetical protein [Spirochaetia bacterium]